MEPWPGGTESLRLPFPARARAWAPSPVGASAGGNQGTFLSPSLLESILKNNKQTGEGEKNTALLFGTMAVILERERGMGDGLGSDNHVYFWSN